MLTTLCPACRHPVPPNVLYCTSCGADVRDLQSQIDTVDLGLTHPQSLPRQEELLQMLREATLGEYEILGELGRGGMATVFLATDMALERRVAIKVMSPILLYGDGMAERFKREARTAGGLSHPHIIPIHAVRETKRLLFFVMKYVDGRSIDQLLKDFGPMSHRMVQAILAQVGSALHYAHRRQIIHRDVKPANIMLDEDGWAVVTDFGIAKVENQSELTKTGSAVGTPYYMSPEQCNGKGVGPASDQYSLGIVAYEMLTGRVPFPGPSIMDVMRSHFLEQPPPIEKHRPDCPATMSRAILRMLAKDPADRFPTVDEAIRAIGAAPLDANDPLRTQMVELARSGPRSRPRVSVPVSPIPLPRRPDSRTPPARATIPGPRPAPRAPRRRTAMVAAAVMVVVAVGGLTLWQRAMQPASPRVPASTQDSLIQPNPVGVTPSAPTSSALTDSATNATKEAITDSATISLRDSIKDTKDATVANPSVAQGPATEPVSLRPQVQNPKPAPPVKPVESARQKPTLSDTAKSGTAVRQDSARVAPPLPPDTTTRVAPSTKAWIKVTTRIPGATIYAEGHPRGPLGSEYRILEVHPGQVLIRVTASGCMPKDDTVQVAPGDTASVGRLNPTCPIP